MANTTTTLLLTRTITTMKRVKEVLLHFTQDILSTFSSSILNYFKYLKKFNGCPYQLYEMHIRLRWKEIQDQWKEICNDYNDLICYLLYECECILKSYLKSPTIKEQLMDQYQQFNKDYKKIYKFYKFVKEMKRTCSDWIAICFNNYRTLHGWLAEFKEKLIHLFELPNRDGWPPGWFCKEHEDKHHCKIDIEIRHAYKYLTPYEIGQQCRIPKKRKLTREYVLKLLQQLQQQLLNCETSNYSFSNTFSNFSQSSFPISSTRKHCITVPTCHTNLNETPIQLKECNNYSINNNSSPYKKKEKKDYYLEEFTEPYIRWSFTSKSYLDRFEIHN
ncbi:hypothetical protein ABK040_015754 [Willaertia magna]